MRSERQISRAFAEQRWQDVLEQSRNLDATERLLLQAHIDQAKAALIEKPASYVGETNALFYDPSRDIGLCLLIGQRSNDDIELCPDYRQAVENARKAVMRLLQREYFPAAEGFTVLPLLTYLSESEKTFTRLEGASIGLASAIIILSIYFSAPIPGDCAFSARIDEHGKLYAVDNLDKKYSGMKRNHPAIKKLYIAAGQPPLQKEDGVIRCCSLKEVVEELWNNDLDTKNIRKDGRIKSLFHLLRFFDSQQNIIAVRDIVEEIITLSQHSIRPSERTCLAYALAHKGLIASHYGKAKEAEVLLRRTLVILDQLGKDVDHSITYYDIYIKYGVWQIDQYEYEEAIRLFNQALGIIENHKFSDYTKIGLWNSMGQLYSKLGDYKKAQEILKKSEEEAKRSLEYNDMSRLYCYQAENEILNGDPMVAEKYLALADKMARPEKQTQGFFNAFWRCCLYFSIGDQKAFNRIFYDLVQTRWFLEPYRYSIHCGYLFGIAAVLNKPQNSQLCQTCTHKARVMILAPKNIFITLLLVKLDAYLMACENSEPLFFSRNKDHSLIEKASQKSKYLNVQIHQLDKLSCDSDYWRSIYKLITF